MEPTDHQHRHEMSPVTVCGYRARGSLAILLPLGFKPLGSRVLQSLFAYRAAALGILFEFLGFGALRQGGTVYLVLLVLQAVRILASAIGLRVGPGHKSRRRFKPPRSLTGT